MLKRFIRILFIGLMMSLIFYAPDIYRYIAEGVLYIGKGDGLKQMIPFQLYLFEHFKHSGIWYAPDFGLGGDYFTNLSYYYSTSPISYITFILLFFYQLFDHHSVVKQLVDMQYVTAIIKCTLVFAAAYYAAKEIGMKHRSALISGILYSWSTIFYYFTYTWSFFSDVMVYLPLSILGLERLLRRNQPLIFILSIAITVFSNFYLAYYEMIAVGIYFLLRLVRQHDQDILPGVKALLTVIVSAVIGFMMGNIGFIAGVSSFLHNDRTLEKLKVPLLIDWSAKNNLFYGGFHLVVIFVAAIALCSFSLYRYYYYRLFSVITWIMMVGSLTPYVGSMFNGFSMSQRRWVYILAFATAILTGLFIQHLSELSIRQLLSASLPVVIILMISVLVQQDFQYWLFYVPVIIILMACYLKYRGQWLMNIIVLAVAFCQLTLIQDYHYGIQHQYFKTTDYMTEHVYNKQMQQAINQLKKNQVDDLRRITLSDNSSVNLPMYYRFNGTMLYSSIFDKQILKFYEEDLKIAQHKQKNSYYAMLSGRTNLASLYNVDDFITASGDHPTLFDKHSKFQAGGSQYEVSTNPYPLPSVRVADKVFAASSLHTPLEKERAMLEGVVKEQGAAGHFGAPDLLAGTQLTAEQATWRNSILTVDGEEGSLIIKLNKQKITPYTELYLTMKSDIIVPQDKDYYIQVNEKKLMKPKKNYKYRRESKDVVMNIKAADEIRISFPKGKYRINLISLQGEDYSVLKNAYQKYKHQPLKLIKKRFSYEVNLKGDKGTLVVPMPYVNGLKAIVDGEERPIEPVNYLMTGIPVEMTDQKVTIKYTPPYLKWGIVVMISGIAAAALFNKWTKNSRLSI
ncbi:hypothetical protein ERX37_09210 [Macrococcus hajekii]|uniref:YfhO family protein n=1 Tax=Macrococcus hajekii TaxID=198482 RepID=A0A4R6BI42_9STAP|nr:YfhO family protein [Macrococcus hajekii]TDM01283.1 hypothetical protein ERX37_09210 [Macrococcus hajekii]GGB10321.1 membrane protein [Macrococcus hajekii]